MGLALPKIFRASTTEDSLVVDLDDGRTLSVPIGWYPRLAHGTPEERATIEICAAGHGLHWPQLDEDVSVEGLLLRKRSSESAASLDQWLMNRQSVKHGH